jgi:GNAT superfamily N-acetyltransferase
MTVCWAAYEVWRESYGMEQVKVMAGHSLGEFCALAAAGAIPISYATFLYGTPPATVEPSTIAAIEVRRASAQDLPTFSSVLLEGHAVPDGDRPLAAAGHARWIHVPGWRLYLATIDGVPAAAAVLRIADGIGYLANSATVPRFRRRGCQAALLHRRIADAREAGCELVAGQAVFGSTSARNQQRAGLIPAFTVTTWRVTRPLEGGG